MEATASRMLSVAAQQFAEKGYSGASMRGIADASGTTQAAIYHHYPNKDALYQAVLEHHFRETTARLLSTLSELEDPVERLQRMIHGMVTMLAEDEKFHRLYQRELLEGDADRLAFLATHVFGELLDFAESLVKDMNLSMDVHQVMTSLAGLVSFHMEARKMLVFLPDSRPENQDLDTIAKHITQLMLQGLR